MAITFCSLKFAIFDDPEKHYDSEKHYDAEKHYDSEKHYGRTDGPSLRDASRILNTCASDLMHFKCEIAPTATLGMIIDQAAKIDELVRAYLASLFILTRC